MQNLLADLCVESEAHTLTAMYLAAAYDASQHGTSMEHSFVSSWAATTEGIRGGKVGNPPCPEEMQELFRVGVAVGKYWVTKRYPTFAYECMEVGEDYCLMSSLLRGVCGGDVLCICIRHH